MFSRISLVFSISFAMCFILAKPSVLIGSEKSIKADSFRGLSGDGEEHNRVALNQVRGHLHKSKKILKHLYPFLVVALLAKLVVVPLILKFLIAATSSAFVMSKIALVTSALVAASWLFGATNEKAKLQIVQYPVGGSKLHYGGWNVKEKYEPNYSTTTFGDWNYYDDNKGETYEKQVFL